MVSAMEVQGLFMDSSCALHGFLTGFSWAFHGLFIFGNAALHIYLLTVLSTKIALKFRIPFSFIPLAVLKCSESREKENDMLAKRLPPQGEAML